MTDTKARFIKKEAINRVRADYGLYPYEPSRPCKILSTAIHYTCECGYRTTSAGDMFDHCAGVVCMAREVQP